MKSIAQKKRYLQHEVTTKLYAVRLYRQARDVQYVCRRYHVSKASLKRWNRRYDGTKESLTPKSRRPKTPHPNAHIDEELSWIRNLHRRNPNISVCEMYGKLREEKAYSRHPGSLYRVCVRLGYRRKAESTKKKSKHLGKYDTPAKLGVKWQMDVKYVPKICCAGRDGEVFFQYTMIEEASVVISVYNTAEYLRACLDSVLAQSLPPFEVILVDDGSSDGSAEICDEYAKAHPECIRAIHQRNQGTAAARNRGLERCTGDYLSFVDSDDYLDPEMYAHLSGLAEEFKADMAAAEMWVEKIDGRRYCRVSKNVRACWNTREALAELNSYRYLHVSFCTALIARRRMMSLQFPEGQACEDYALLYQVVAECEQVAYSSQPLYHYVQRPNSSSRTIRVSPAPMEISKAQVLFFQKNYPEIAYAAETDCAFAHMGIYTAYARNKQKCPKGLLQELLKTSRHYLPSVLRNGRIPFIKKIQAAVFCLSPGAYGYIISKTEHR